MTDAALQQKLRNAGQATEGTGPLLLQAADEIAELKRRLVMSERRVEGLENALRDVRTQLNKTVAGVIGGE